MKLISITPIKNEDWILPCWLHALEQLVDHAVVVDNGSWDETSILLHKYRHFVTVLEDGRKDWDEVSLRSRCLETARGLAATHILILDADEIVTANCIPTIQEWCETAPPGSATQLACMAMWKSPHTYRDDRTRWSKVFMPFLWALSPDVRYHSSRDPMHRRWPAGREYPLTTLIPWGRGGVMHLQFAAFQRMREKHAWYKMYEVACNKRPVRSVDAKYSRAPDKRGLLLSRVPDKWWDDYHLETIKWNAPSHYPSLCRLLLATYGPETFRGLNLWGVVSIP